MTTFARPQTDRRYQACDVQCANRARWEITETRPSRTVRVADVVMPLYLCDMHYEARAELLKGQHKPFAATYWPKGIA